MTGHYKGGGWAGTGSSSPASYVHTRNFLLLSLAFLFVVLTHTVFIRNVLKWSCHFIGIVSSFWSEICVPRDFVDINGPSAP